MDVTSCVLIQKRIITVCNLFLFIMHILIPIESACSVSIITARIICSPGYCGEDCNVLCSETRRNDPCKFQTKALFISMCLNELTIHFTAPQPNINGTNTSSNMERCPKYNADLTVGLLITLINYANICDSDYFINHGSHLP